MKHLKVALTALAVCALAACSSTPIAPRPTDARPPASTATAPAATGSTVTPSSTVTPVTVAPHADPSSQISKERSIYFDFDDFSINRKFHTVIELHGKYLQPRASLTIRVEGHADERGGAEYNLALGQRRAEAVVGALAVYGVKSFQMEAISFGSERPRRTGRDEAAWAENRRADIVYRE